MIEKNNSSPEARAKRVKRLRNLADLSRKNFCELGAININTLIGWEVARYGGLPLKGAEKVLSAVAKRGVQCSIEWLMYEIGKGPSLLPDFEKAVQDKESGITEPLSLDSEENKILEELLLFKKQYKNVADFIVADDGMEPFYSKGDYVAGVKRFKTDISSTAGLHCIVQMEDGRILLRKVRKETELNYYSLFCINHTTTIAEPIIYNIELVSSAPVIWLRRKNN